MKQGPPAPKLVAFVMCQRLVTDQRLGDYGIIGPGSEVVVPHFPCRVPRSFYVELTECRGQCSVTLKVRDADNQLIDAWPKEGVAEFGENNPLALGRFCIFDAPFRIPVPGRFDLLLLVNGQEIGRRPLLVALQPEQGRAG